MYTNIPLEEGIEAFRVELDKRDDKQIPTEFLIRLLKLVLEGNIFEFNGEFWRQLLGTAMGTRVAPTYANIFMNFLESAMIDDCPDRLKRLIFAWKRFIDDILLLFLGTREELKELHQYLNSYHPTMKFDEPDYDEDENSTKFLDMKIKIEENKIITDLYRKPTDRPTALLPSSAHPGHIRPNIVYSMSFRLLRICSIEDIFEIRLQEMKNNFLKPRGYSPKMIEEQFEKIRNLPGDSFIERRQLCLEKKKKENKKEDRIIVPVDFNPHMANPGPVFKKHYTAMVRKNSELKEVFPAPPMAALRQGKNLRRMLCSSKLHPVKRLDRVRRGVHKDSPGWKNCKKPCPVCPYTLPACTEVNGNNGFVHPIKQSVNCSTENCVYYWKCVKPNCSDFPECEYVGMTSRSFQARMSEHRDYPKRDVTTEPSGYHFTQRGHNVSDLKGLVLEKIKSKDPFVLRARENMLIKKFDTYRHGLNNEP